MSVDLPGQDRQWDFQEVSLWFNLSKRNWKDSDLLLVRNIGLPNYLASNWSFLMHRTSLTFLLFEGVVFLEKWIPDFLAFIFCPPHIQNLSSNCSQYFTFFSFAFMKTIKSSTNSRWMIGGEFQSNSTLFIWPLFSALTNNQDNISIERMKRYGDTGSPWRTPHEDLKNPLGLPFISTENVGELMRRSIHWMNV